MLNTVSFLQETEIWRIKVNSRRSIRRLLLIATIIATVLLLIGCTVVYVLKMESMKIGEGTYSLSDGVYVEDPLTVYTNTLTLASLEGARTYKACADFYAFKKEYTDTFQRATKESKSGGDNTAYHDSKSKA